MLSALRCPTARVKGAAAGVQTNSQRSRVAAWQRGSVEAWQDAWARMPSHRCAATAGAATSLRTWGEARQAARPRRPRGGRRRRPRPHTRSSLVESLAIRRAGAGRLGWRPRIHLLMTQIDRSQQSAAAPCRRVQILT
jgi:hypothetical protein